MPTIIINPAVALYLATAVALVAMIAFLMYLWSVDRQVQGLRRSLSKHDTIRSYDSATTSHDQARKALRPERIEQELTDGIDGH